MGRRRMTTAKSHNTRRHSSANTQTRSHSDVNMKRTYSSTCGLSSRSTYTQMEKESWRERERKRESVRKRTRANKQTYSYLPTMKGGGRRIVLDNVEREGRERRSLARSDYCVPHTCVQKREREGNGGGKKASVGNAKRKQKEEALSSPQHRFWCAIPLL